VSAPPLSTAPTDVTVAGPVAPPALNRWLPQYLALAAIWGSSFLFIKVGIRELPPTYVALGRIGAGALTLLIVLAVTRTRLPRLGRVWGHLAVIGLVGNVIPFTLFGYGEQRVSSIVAGIWNATTPLMVLLVVLVFLPSERPTWRRVVGLGVGFAGVLVVLGVWHGLGGAQLVGQLCCAGAAICYGMALPHTRRVVLGRTESGVALAATQLLLATVELAVLAPFVGGRPPSPPHLSMAVVGSVLALGVLGTGLAFVFNYRIIALLGATMSSSVTYLVPIFATALGVLVLHESLHWYEPVGAVVILGGIALTQYKGRRVVPVLPVPAPVEVT
jgi:drug/metabolite transporter (DMT)-like permease